LRALQGTAEHLPRLTSRGLQFLDELLSALTKGGQHNHLRELGLRHISKPLTHDGLRAVCKALPNLRAMGLRSSTCLHIAPNVILATVATATARLVCMEALQTSDVVYSELSLEHIMGWAACKTWRTTCMHDGGVPAGLQQLTPLSRLCFEGPDKELGLWSVQRCFDIAHVAALAAQLPAQATMDLCSRAGARMPSQQPTCSA
jgi:hypothetical protein